MQSCVFCISVCGLIVAQRMSVIQTNRINLYIFLAFQISMCVSAKM